MSAGDAGGGTMADLSARARAAIGDPALGGILDGATHGGLVRLAEGDLGADAGLNRPSTAW